MNYVGHWFCLFVSWVTFVRHLCLSVCWLGELCWALVFYVCWLRDFCRALGLSVGWVGDLCLVMFGLFGTSIADYLFLEYLVVLKRTAY